VGRIQEHCGTTKEEAEKRVALFGGRCRDKDVPPTRP
jgi:hypothetical protein